MSRTKKVEGHSKVNGSHGLDTGPKVVVIGGGSGISNILRGLKHRTHNLTAIVTMFDSGGSSGVLREEFGFPAFGDLRQCLLALRDDDQPNATIGDALEYRFGSESSLNGHSVGNLLLAALTSVNADLERALEDVSRFLNAAGQVIPVTLERAELCAELVDGQVIRGESDIDLRKTALPSISRIFLDARVAANPRAVEALKEADAIVFGPGDLYTSILPNLLADGIAGAVASSAATRICVSNIMTKNGETDGFKASDFVREVINYLGGDSLDWAIVNTSVPEPFVRESYAGEGAYLVREDVDEVSKFVPGVIAAPLAASELPLRHDPQRTTAAIFQVLMTGRASKTSADSPTLMSRWV